MAVIVRCAATPGWPCPPGRRSSRENSSARICPIGRSSPSALAIFASSSSYRVGLGGLVGRQSAPRVAMPSGPGCRNTSACRFASSSSLVDGGGVQLGQQLQRPDSGAWPPTGRSPRAAGSPRPPARAPGWWRRARRPARRPAPGPGPRPTARRTWPAGCPATPRARWCRWLAVPRPRLSTSASSEAKNSLTPAMSRPPTSPAVRAPGVPGGGSASSGRLLGQPQDQLRLVRGIHPLPPLPPLQLRDRLLPRQQLHRQPRRIDRPLQRPVDQHPLDREEP